MSCTVQTGKDGIVVGLDVRDVALSLSAKGMEAIMAKPGYVPFALASCSGFQINLVSFTSEESSELWSYLDSEAGFMMRGKFNNSG